LRARKYNDWNAPERTVQPRERVAPGRREILRPLTRLVSTVCAMSGWRLEHLNASWVAGGIASMFLAHALIARADWRLTLPYFAFTLIFYYGGNTLILRSHLPARAVARLGEERAFRVYETLVGLMFLNQGLGVGCMAALHASEWERTVPAPLVVAAGAVLFLTGLVVKLWATLTVGVDAYYFRDMFLGRPLAPACDAGPYRFLRNPMYSLGQLQGYGYALLWGSLPGLLAAAAGQLLIYGFYAAAERPFVRNRYMRSRPASAIGHLRVFQRRQSSVVDRRHVDETSARRRNPSLASRDRP
jgi:protein-S-isoprenylcysteine O-methyltransferase Ste14